MRKPTLLLAALVFWACEPTAFPKQFRAEQFNIDIRVLQGNLTEIVETTVSSFTSGTFS